MAGFLVDENLPARLAEELSSRGFPSRHVSDTPALRSAPDEEIVAHAEREGLILITKDKDLSFITRIPGASRTGVVGVRLRDNLAIMNKSASSPPQSPLSIRVSLSGASSSSNLGAFE